MRSWRSGSPSSKGGDPVSLKTARLLAVGYFVAAAVAFTWPGYLPAARIRPIVFGLPFSFFWMAVWIVGSVVALWLLDRVERRYRD